MNSYKYITIKVKELEGWNTIKSMAYS
jgi:hypothetical protein